VVLVIVGLLVGVRLLTASSHVSAPASPPAAPAPLVVGDDRTVTMISLGGAATDALLARVGTNIGAAVAAVEAFWGTDWSHEILVVAAGTDAEFAAQAGQETAAGADIAAVAVADQVDPSRGLATGQRIVLAPGAAQMSDAALRIVLGHELFHYASRADTALDAPRWLTEGVADYVGRPATPVPHDQPLPTALPSDAEFAADGPQLSLAYDRAWLFARFVADVYGAPALRQLYVRACGPGHTDVPTALRETLGAGPDDVLARWRQWWSA
jgi:hypothetical protein